MDENSQDKNKGPKEAQPVDIWGALFDDFCAEGGNSLSLFSYGLLRAEHKAQMVSDDELLAMHNSKEKVAAYKAKAEEDFTEASADRKDIRLNGRLQQLIELGHGTHQMVAEMGSLLDVMHQAVRETGVVAGNIHAAATESLGAAKRIEDAVSTVQGTAAELTKKMGKSVESLDDIAKKNETIIKRSKTLLKGLVEVMKGVVKLDENTKLWKSAALTIFGAVAGVGIGVAYQKLFPDPKPSGEIEYRYISPDNPFSPFYRPQLPFGVEMSPKIPSFEVTTGNPSDVPTKPAPLKKKHFHKRKHKKNIPY